LRAIAWIELDGREVALGHGDLIGRLPGVALQIDDGRVSEAHALVSLRGATLRLLALRGRFAVHRTAATEVELVAGLTITLAPGVDLTVTRVQLPATVLGVRLADSAPVVLRGTTSLVAEPHAAGGLRLEAGDRDDALATIWALGVQWRVRVAGQPAQTLRPGPLVLSEGVACHVVVVPLSQTDVLPTRPGRVAPIRWRVFPSGVELQPIGGAPLHVGGLQGRLLQALLQSEHALDWREAAAIVWDGDRADARSLRRRLDTLNNRLRKTLRDGGLDPHTLRLDGAGTIRLVRGPYDEVTVLPDEDAAPSVLESFGAQRLEP